MKSQVKVQTMLKHGAYEIRKLTDTRFGSWHYGLFCGGQWQEWSYDFAKLKAKIFA